MTFNPFSAPQIPWLPPDQGSYLLANGDPALMIGGTILVAGTLYLCKLQARTSIPLSAVRFSINSNGVGASTGSFGGIYSSAGNLLSGSADIGGLLTGAGDLNIPLSIPGQIVPGNGFVWAAILSNLATTQPTMNRLTSSTNTGANMALAAAGLRFAINGTGLVSLPSSINPASNISAGAIALWAGGS